jgi:hypothetical protein
MATLPKSAARALYPNLPSSEDVKPALAQARAGGNAASRMFPKLPSDSRRSFVMVPVYVPPKRIKR